MDLSSLKWSAAAMDFFGVRRECLADRIVSNAEHVGSFARGPLKGTPITSMVGDQHAALIGQKCLSEGMVRTPLLVTRFMCVGTDLLFRC